jgi:hypothetical protein
MLYVAELIKRDPKIGSLFIEEMYIKGECVHSFYWILISNNIIYCLSMLVDVLYS